MVGSVACAGARGCSPCSPPRRPSSSRTAPTLLLATALTGCGSDPAPTVAKKGQIVAVGAETQYANVIAQIGGRYVAVSAIESNPNTDPHEFQASPAIAQEVAAANIVVQNGLGYDAFMDRIEAASPNPARRVIDVHGLLRLRRDTTNPHLWYAPATMPAVARELTSALSKLQPAHAGYFAANERRFDAELTPWRTALSAFRARHPRTPVAVTEPVGDYMLQAAGASIMTPASLESAVMNGIDPAPQDVAAQHTLLETHRVRALLYNQQVTDTVTDSFLAQAKRLHIPVVGLYETMPAGYDYQSWMLAEVRALERAVTQRISTETLT